ncbi:MAG: stage II sporulation protein P [Ruminiclostridium sp.]|nr:stage II sporulation protein P [Ruminiclostridium sp.]
MMMIRTNVRRKLTSFFVSAAAVTLVFASLAAVSRSFPQYGGAEEEVPDSSEMFASTDIVNDAPGVLYEAAGTEPPAEEAPPKAEPEEAPAPVGRLLTVNRSDEHEDLNTFTVHSGRIAEQTFGSSGGAQFIDLPGGGQLRNCTDIDNEKIRYASGVSSGISVELYSDEPQVLIVHTHTTESYEPYEKDWYDESYTSRSHDPGNGVVAVGEAIAEKLAAAGITTVHDCTIHDGVYNGAYSRSLSTTVDALYHYPSIKVVLDIHRDAIEYEDGTRVSAVTDIDGKKAAQVMIICAADDGSYGVPDFYENLHFACELQSAMESGFPTLTRPVLFQYCQYNQQVSPGALLIEVGSHGNSIEQAVYSGGLIGEALASLLTKKAQPIEAVPVLASVPMYFIGMVR